MALRRPPSILASTPALNKPWTCTTCRLHHLRPMHKLHAPTQPMPQPTPFVPDAQTFLTLIGRNMSKHASKIPSWEALFNLSSAELKQNGIEPARARRYLLWWRERYRGGIMGVGGDLTRVQDGVAELRVVEVPSARSVDRRATLSHGAGMRKVVINVPPTVVLPEDPTAALDGNAHAKPADGGEGGAAREDGEAEVEGVDGKHAVEAETLPLAPLPVELDAANIKPVGQVKIVGSDNISGTGVEAVKGYRGVARLKVKDGLWEERRGHKVDGGERRQAEVRFKRKVAEKKNAR